MSVLTYISLTTMLLLSSFMNPSEETFSLSVEVNELRNSTGVVQFALYNEVGSIPDEHYENYYRLLSGRIVNGSSRITFEHLPPGSYAVNILHDENKNGKIDKGMILPKEGIGFSNFGSIGLRNRPNYDKASFELKGNRTIEVKVIYM
ncbi:MAG: DUF2141 domain-containing protein [Flavobacteriales bacterium]|jgi:uncharacterized protein (DUF2141 family)|nr:DUF2141 domain-containing protein [Flavobacteriales bacterium]MBK6884129.1 DUF2141 domain-containing protein [Flavobacteriales bacterium]MBK7100509.1 DUF2141 domain-containing protein [Flavobacteriales bacterium]MBK7111205.1 DUF2141 domain-containing protein [Flavobacteriales bacterium]MBK7484436.1 DUF2141 domain-containing protein [Flavobacteriales bacterium]